MDVDEIKKIKNKLIVLPLPSENTLIKNQIGTDRKRTKPLGHVPRVCGKW